MQFSFVHSITEAIRILNITAVAEEKLPNVEFKIPFKRQTKDKTVLHIHFFL